MQSENLYIGDDKFQRFLDHYHCPTPIEVVKLKFAGAICSPNSNLRPTDVISSLFYREQQPRLETKAEAEYFFKFFMGLWDEMFIFIRTNTLKLSSYNGSNCDREALIKLCLLRQDEIEFGFVEGFWGGCQEIKIPQFAAELISSLSDLREIYHTMEERLTKGEDTAILYKVIQNTDKTVEKTFHFLIENLVEPHISQLERKLN